MLQLYDYLSSGNGYKVRLLLTQLAIPYELIERDIIKGETRTAEFLTKFPNGRIPAVEFDDGKLLSSQTRSSATSQKTHNFFQAADSSARRFCNGCSSSSTVTNITSPACATWCTWARKFLILAARCST